MNIDEIYKGAAPEQLKLAHDIHSDTMQIEAKWIAELRAMGVKAAHWNNGYVDRVNNVVDPKDLFFDDGVAVGDLIAIGNYPDWYNSTEVRHRIVRVVDLLPTCPPGEGSQWVFAPLPGEPDNRESIEKQGWYGSLAASINARKLAEKRVRSGVDRTVKCELLRQIAKEAESAETILELKARVIELCREHGLNYSQSDSKPNFFEFYKDAERIGDITFAERPLDKKHGPVPKIKDGFRKLKKLLARMVEGAK